MGALMQEQKQARERIARTPSRQVMFWFGLSLAFAMIFGILALRQAFSSEYVVQDDMRVYIWMQQFVDPELFQHDLITDYFQSVTPPGYAAFYWLMACVGVEPLFLSKVLPTMLGLITTGYCFGVCMKMLPVPSAGFIATLLLNQALWIAPDLISATPRAFVYPLFLAFLYYLLRRSLPPCLVALALQGLFFPQGIFISAGVLILRLLHWKGDRLRFSQDRSDYLFCATGLAVALLVMLPYVLKSSEFGPVVTAAEARGLPDFLPGGRQPFFIDNPLKFWLTGSSGIVPAGWLRMQLPLILTGLLLPILLRYPARFPLIRQITSGGTILPQIVLVSLGLFFAAHALFFNLYFPNRYTWHSLRVVMALAAGMALTVMLDAVFRWAEQQASPRPHGRQFLALGSTAMLGAALVLHPVYLKLKNIPFPRTDYVVGGAPSLYEFFAQQPKDILIASLAEEANNLPTFSKRSILVGREYANPYHVGYYRQISQRATGLIRAQYSQDLSEVQNFIRTYGVDFLLLDRTAFTPEYMANHRWVNYFQPTATETLAKLDQGTIPALSSFMEHCSVLETGSLIVLQAKCILEASQE